MSKKPNPKDFSIRKEDKDDPRQSVIARGNLTNEFTLADIEKQLGQLEKMKRELDAQIKVTSAVVNNIERNHEFVKDFSGEELATLAYYQENTHLLRDSKKKLGEVEESLQAHNDVLEVLYDKFGFVKSDILDSNGQETDRGTEEK